MTTPKPDGGPAAFLSDEQCEQICRTIKRGYGKGFPMIGGNMVGWADWLRSEVADAMIAERERKE